MPKGVDSLLEISYFWMNCRRSASLRWRQSKLSAFSHQQGLTANRVSLKAER